MPLNLYKPKAGGPYWVRGTLAGQRIHRSTRTGNRAQAEAWAIRLETQILDRHAYGERATLTFAEAALDYMQTGGEPRFLAKILHHFGEDLRVAEIDNATLARAAAALYPKASAATINRQLIAPVSAVINRAAENGRADPRKFHKIPTKSRRTRWLDPAEMDRILDKAQPHLVPILAVLIGGGCRVSEALAIDRADFHPATGEIWLARTKNGHPRMIRLPARARDLVLAHGVPPQGALLRTPKGQPFVLRDNTGGQIQAAFNKARDAAGLGRDVTPHTLRHSWATWYYAATRDYGGLLDLGGWRSSAAEIYRKIAPANLADRLLAHGWDFTALGADLPAPARPDLRVVR